MILLYWCSLITMTYTFIGYPLLLLLCSWLVVNRHRCGRESSATLPQVSIVLSVYNEEQVIAAKIANFLALDYPPELVEMVVVSDCSSDSTDTIIRSSAGDRVKLFVQPERRGKTFNLNRGVTEAAGELLIFTDANSMFASDALKKLVAPFTDPQVGLVSGRSIYLETAQKIEVAGGAYRAYEEWLKVLESRVGSIVGADGAIYALRKELYEPLPPAVINDFVHTIQVVKKGYRAISEPQARCSEEVDSAHSGEFSRQVRMMTQSWRIYFSSIGGLLIRGRFVYALELTSHKLLRWLVLPNLTLLFCSNLLILDRHSFFVWSLIAQIIFWIGAGAGRFLGKGVARLPYLFVTMHAAALVGLFRWIIGQNYIIWNPRQS